MSKDRKSRQEIVKADHDLLKPLDILSFGSEEDPNAPENEGFPGWFMNLNIPKCDLTERDAPLGEDIPHVEESFASMALGKPTLYA